MNSGTTFALPGPPSDRGWARQPLGREERKGGNDDSLGRGLVVVGEVPSLSFHWTCVPE